MPPIKNPLPELNKALWRRVNTAREWHQLPVPLALLNLRAFRDELRELNLYDTRKTVADTAAEDEPASGPKYRTYDGSQTDVADAEMGAVESRFGRNMPLDTVRRETGAAFMTPNPRDVSRELFTRDSFKPATSLNVLAAAWIQFQNHDWFGHGENSPSEFIDIELADGDDWGENPMRVRQTSADRTNGDPSSPTYPNKATHWWDLSQVYGSTEQRNRELRSGEDGKLKLTDGGLLPNETAAGLDGVDLTGFNDNYWIGLSLLHTLFVKEHNAICDMLKRNNPSWDDEKLFLTARLINSALSAKIHTVEWTPGILANPVLERAMNTNWYGLLPKWSQKVLGNRSISEGLTGIMGSPLEYHAAPFSITEEFVSVYRLHPLIPDEYDIRDHRSGSRIEVLDFMPIQGHGTRPTIEKYGFESLLYSFGTAHPGAITLHNHPHALQNFTRLSGERIDLGTIDVLRDRERGVLRYNDFREQLRKPRVQRFEDLTPNPEWNAQIRDVYEGDIDRVDLQVGLLGEPVPPGFGFSDTAFRIFILMASRRLKSDRFFTNDYTPEVYTAEGLEWIEDTNMSKLVLRHHPELAPALDGVKNAFAPWKTLG
jgi:hypothetical protein